MWSRFLNVFSTGWSTWRLSAATGPVPYFLSLLAVILTPYLAYILWGSLIVAILAGIGVWAIIRFITKRLQRSKA